MKSIRKSYWILTVGSISLVFIFSLLSSYLTYQKSIRDKEDHLLEQTRVTAESIRNMVKVEELMLVDSPEKMETKEYQNIATMLQSFTDVAGLNWSGIYKYDDVKKRFIYWADPSTGYGYPFFYATDTHYEVFYSGKGKPIHYSDEFGEYIGYTLPIYDQESKHALGLIEVLVDMSAMELQRQGWIHENWWLILGAGLTGSATLLLLLLQFKQRVMTDVVYLMESHLNSADGKPPLILSEAKFLTSIKDLNEKFHKVSATNKSLMSELDELRWIGESACGGLIESRIPRAQAAIQELFNAIESLPLELSADARAEQRRSLMASLLVVQAELIQMVQSSEGFLERTRRKGVSMQDM